VVVGAETRVGDYVTLPPGLPSQEGERPEQSPQYRKGSSQVPSHFSDSLNQESVTSVIVNESEPESQEMNQNLRIQALLRCCACLCAMVRILGLAGLP
jgi:hypothetical protein